jgi:hypothetical protein
VRIVPKGEVLLVCSFNLVRCSDMFKIGSGCLIASTSRFSARTAIAGKDAHRDSDKPEVVEDERTTEISSVSIALIFTTP